MTDTLHLGALDTLPRRGTATIVYDFLSMVKVGYDNVHYHKEHYQLTLWFPNGARERLKFYSPERNIHDFFAFVKLVLKNDYKITENNVAKEKKKRRETPTDYMKRGLISAEEQVTMEDIQNVHPRLSYDDIRGLLRTHTRSEIIGGRFRGFRFYPADLFDLGKTIGLEDQPTCPSIM